MDWREILKLEELNLKISKEQVIDWVHHHCQTIEEAHEIIESITANYPEADRIAIGLLELLINAIEHGNLGITYHDKHNLLQEERWTQEVENRLKKPQNSNKWVDFYCIKAKTKEGKIKLIFIIRDKGEGFDWRKYQEVDTERLLDLHGRGIAIAYSTFHRLQYNKRGNAVAAVWKL